MAEEEPVGFFPVYRSTLIFFACLYSYEGIPRLQSMVKKALKVDVFHYLDYRQFLQDCPEDDPLAAKAERLLRHPRRYSTRPPRPSTLDSDLQDFGRAAKKEVLSVGPAQVLADQKAIHLEGINGTGAGIIGALAAIGLHASGDDGRFIWLPKLRELDGTYSVDELTKLLGVEIKTTTGEALPPAAEIESSDWMRPIMRKGRAILLAEKENIDGEISWRLADKPTIKALSD